MLSFRVTRICFCQFDPSPLLLKTMHPSSPTQIASPLLPPYRYSPFSPALLLLFNPLYRDPDLNIRWLSLVDLTVVWRPDKNLVLIVDINEELTSLRNTFLADQHQLSKLWSPTHQEGGSTLSTSPSCRKSLHNWKTLSSLLSPKFFPTQIWWARIIFW